MRPDSFKGSNTTIAVANRIEKGIRKVFPDAEIVKIPIADGGEGTVDALVLGAGGVIREKEVTGPLGEKVIGKYGILHNGIGRGGAGLRFGAAVGSRREKKIR